MEQVLALETAYSHRYRSLIVLPKQASELDQYPCMPEKLNLL